jgi:hypothetical protein
MFLPIQICDSCMCLLLKATLEEDFLVVSYTIDGLWDLQNGGKGRYRAE